MENLYSAEDATLASELVTEQSRIIERKGVLLRYSAFSGGTPDAGVKPTRVVVPIEISMQMRLLTGKDIVSNGGIYALGDYEGTTKTPIYAADAKLGTEADKLLIDGTTYTMRGNPYPVWFAAGVTFWRAVWRSA